MDFYKFGECVHIEDKYNPDYIKQQGQDGTQYLGPCVLLHDVLSQVMHCRNILLKEPRFRYDEQPLREILSERMTQRIEIFKKLPRMAAFNVE